MRLGAALSWDRNFECVEHLEAATGHVGLARTAYEHLVAYYADLGDCAAVTKYRALGIQAALAANYANAERNNISETDNFDPHGMDADTLAGVVAVLKEVKGVTGGYVVRKQVQYLKEVPLWIVVATIHDPFYWRNTDGERNWVSRQVFDRLNVPGHLFVYVPSKDTRWMVPRFRKIPGAKVM